MANYCRAVTKSPRGTIGLPILLQENMWPILGVYINDSILIASSLETLNNIEKKKTLDQFHVSLLINTYVQAVELASRGQKEMSSILADQ